jgi:hypothetical protein
VAGEVILKFRGLRLAQSNATSPDGSCEVADNVVANRDHLAEPRRGHELPVSKAISRGVNFKNALVGWGTAALARSLDYGATWTDYSGTYNAPSGGKFRAQDANGNLYFLTDSGVKRLDALTGTPEDAGVPPALDVQATVGAAGSAVQNNKQVGYRVVWGKKDSNGNVLLGAPSGRTVVVNTSGGTKDINVALSLPPGINSSHFFQAYRTPESADENTDPGDEMGLVYEGPPPSERALTQLVRATNVVTATATVDHGYATGQIVRVSPGGALSSHAVGVGDSSAAERSADAGDTWSAAGISGLSGTYYGVTSRGTLYCAVGNNVCATSPDGLTWTPRTIPAGMYRAVVWTGSQFVAVGAGVCATSPDGTTWTARTFPATSGFGLAWNGSTLVAVGNGGFCATSPDGVTWTLRASLGTTHYAVVWTGSLFVAVGGAGGVAAACSTSPDGVTWTARTVPSSSGKSLYSVAWSGSALAAVGNSFAASSPDGVTWTARTIPAGTYNAVGWLGSQFAAIGNNVAATSADAATWTARSSAAGFFNCISAGGGASFAPGEKTITGTPSTTTFTYTEVGTDGTLAQAQTATPLTAGFVDSVPTGFTGTKLYTNETQQGVAQAAFEPPLCRDIVAFKGSMFWLNVTDRATLEAWMITVPQSGDTVTINGVVYTAGASETISTRTFQVYSAGTPTQNIQNTASSLIRVVNRSQGSAVTAQDVSDPNGTPGHIRFVTRSRADSITVAFSRSTTFSTQGETTAAPKTQANEIRWSPNGKPDAAPLVNYARVGSQDKAGFRALSTRESLFILKDDGVWRLTGENGVWDISPFDPTIQIIAPESAVVIDNAIVCLSEQGVVRISEGGTEVLSRPIEPLLWPLLAVDTRSTVDSLAFGVAYESDRKYLLWLPEQAGASTCTQAFVYDFFSQVWTRRTDSAVGGLVSSQDDRLYTFTGTEVRRERKTYTAEDFQDGTSAIVTEIAWIPRLLANPGLLKHWQEAILCFQEYGPWTSATVGFATEISIDEEAVTLSNDQIQTGGAVLPAELPAFFGGLTTACVRVLVPLEKRRSTQLGIRWVNTATASPFRLQGLIVKAKPTSLRVSR